MKINLNKKIITGLFVLSAFLVIQFYSIVETVFAVADSAEVTLTVDSGISISNGADEVMEPNLSITQHKSVGTSTWTVITNDPDGYQLVVTADTVPAMKSATSEFADYTEATAGTPETWAVSNAVEFGYSAFGSQTPAAWGTGAASCGNTTTGVVDASLKFSGVATANDPIATSSDPTPIAGVLTTICFAAEQETVFAEAGAYHANITGTATVL
ncbi:MAG: hypothetical protein WC447_00030 [Candidatus Paceibacterota bacterium]|jgi:hypothetical protein